MTTAHGFTPPDPRDLPIYGASFTQAVRRFFSKYASFKGRASRSEHWWVQLFLLLGYVVLIAPAVVIATTTGPTGGDEVPPAAIVFLVALGVGIVAVILPSLALLVRRLHDVNFSGWWVLLGLIPYLGGFVLFIFTLLSSDPQGARFDRFPTIPTAPAIPPAPY